MQEERKNIFIMICIVSLVLENFYKSRILTFVFAAFTESLIIYYYESKVRVI